VKYANATAKVVGTVAFAYAAYIKEQTERTKTKNMRCSLSEVYTHMLDHKQILQLPVYSHSNPMQY
jgi:hypothetical protein